MTLREVDNMSEWRKDTVNGQTAWNGARQQEGEGEQGMERGRRGQGEVRGQKLAHKQVTFMLPKQITKRQRRSGRKCVREGETETERKRERAREQKSGSGVPVCGM